MKITRLKWANASRESLRISADDGERFAPWPDLRTWHREIIQAAIDGGMQIEEHDPSPPPTQEELDTLAARQYAKLQALRNMSPAQVDAWVEANVNTLAQAKDALKTLAIAVSILARRI